MSLKEYVRKRNFRKTKEPAAKRARQRSSHRFVIQKHAASRLHYDFRLEMDGVLKSWAVPKGVPFVKGEKRLAVHVEDHPVSYIDFEGTIPQGEYGGGTVMVWYRGTFEPLDPAPLKALEAGKLHLLLHGKKLEGEWRLVRLRAGDQWLLIKSGEDMKPVSARQDDRSVISGKNMKQLSRSEKVWSALPQSRKKKELSGGRTQKPKEDSIARIEPPVRKAAFKFIEPMKARLVDAPATQGEWIYEVKFDGFRALAFKHGDETHLLSRNEKDFDEKFPGIRKSIIALKVQDAVLDGEIVALDAQGRSSFQLLQAYEMGQERPPLYFYVFDLLRLNGKELLDRSLLERKKHLKALLKKPPELIRYSASLKGEAQTLLRQAHRLGLEGLIGKRIDSIYESGSRSGAWIKLKLHHEQEFVIGGYTPPEGSRMHFGALLIGYYEKGKLLFCGKVGTGFNQKLLEALHRQFLKLGRATCPFANLPEKRRPRYGQAITVAEMRRCKWISPRLVCQIRFSEWTRDGKLRQPVFLGLRDDKPAREVIREKAVRV